jgi:hypothetical protein
MENQDAATRREAASLLACAAAAETGYSLRRMSFSFMLSSVHDGLLGSTRELTREAGRVVIAARTAPGLIDL